MTRSMRYRKMSDEEILDLATTKLSDNDRYYLIQELEYRNLRDQVKPKKIEKMQSSKRPRTIGSIIFVVLLFIFGISKLGSRMFNF